MKQLTLLVPETRRRTIESATNFISDLQIDHNTSSTNLVVGDDGCFLFCNAKEYKDLSTEDKVFYTLDKESGDYLMPLDTPALAAFAERFNSVRNDVAAWRVQPRKRTGP